MSAPARHWPRPSRLPDLWLAAQAHLLGAVLRLDAAGAVGPEAERFVQASCRPVLLEHPQRDDVEPALGEQRQVVLDEAVADALACGGGSDVDRVDMAPP